MAATNHTATYPNFSWMSLCYMLVCIIAVILAVGMNVVARYHVSVSTAYCCILVRDMADEQTVDWLHLGRRRAIHVICQRTHLRF